MSFEILEVHFANSNAVFWHVLAHSPEGILIIDESHYAKSNFQHSVAQE